MNRKLVTIHREKNQDSLYVFRILFALTKKQIRVRYNKSILGFLWSLLNPLIFFSIFVFLFNRVFPEIENYPLFALIGVFHWNFFSNTTSQVLRSLIASAPFLKSMPIPIIIYPTSVLASCLTNFLMSLIPFFLIFLVIGGNIGFYTLLLPIFIALFTAMIAGWSLLLATLNVYFRDVEILWTTLTPALLYLTPVAYPSTMIPETYRWSLNLNPLYIFIDAFRTILYYESIPSLRVSLQAVLMSGFFCCLGYAVFKKLEMGVISTV